MSPRTLRTVVALAAGWPLLAAAHAFPEHSSPGAGATLIAPPPAIRMQFSAPLEGAFSHIKVTDQQGHDIVAAPATVDPAHPDVIQAKLKPVPPGRYEVHWSVVADDGHHTEGNYNFRVTTAGHR